MATFEHDSVSGAATSQQYQKFPLRRLEPAIHKFLKVIQIDLARLHRHRLNVERFQRLHDWRSLHTEQINATRTVQQIKANLQEIEKSRLQVEEEDVGRFDEKIGPMKHDAVQAVQDFLHLNPHKSDTVRGDNTACDSCSDEERDPLVRGGGGQGVCVLEPNLQLQVEPDNTEAAQSWHQLQENLQDLNQMIHQYASLVNEQQEHMDSLEENIEHAHADVNTAVKHLAKASRYQAVVYPVAGAILGTVVGGPIGLVAGAKIGGLVSLVGGTAGFLSGRFVKKRKDRATEIELSNLSRSRSNSLPEVRETLSAAGNTWLPWRRFRNNSESYVDVETRESELSGCGGEADSWEKINVGGK